MNRLLLKRTCLLPLVFSIGCGPALIVKKKGTKTDGIPFYIKKAVCLHQMVFVAPYYQITFQSLVGDKVIFSRTVTISEDDLRDTHTQAFLSLMRKKPPLSPEDFQSASDDWDEMEKLNATPYHGIAASPKPWPTYLVANSTAPKVYVDYDDTHTINAKVPFAGSVNADYKLNADGTLTEASAQVTEETLKTILSALPISDLIKTAAGAALATEMLAAPTATASVTIQAAVEPRALKITYSQNSPFVPGCPDLAGFDAGQPKGVAIEDGATKSESANKSDDNSINVTGKITLPKSPTTPQSLSSGDLNKSVSPTATSSSGASDKGNKKKPE